MCDVSVFNSSEAVLINQSSMCGSLRSDLVKCATTYNCVLTIKLKLKPLTKPPTLTSPPTYPVDAEVTPSSAPTVRAIFFTSRSLRLSNKKVR